MMLRVVFMGSPEFSVSSLQAIATAGHNIVAVYSQPPRPAGRGLADLKSPVHQAAETLGIPVFTPRTVKDEAAAEQFRSHNADVAIVIAYGLILPPDILSAPRFGCLNGHASKLPRWRGAAPIQRAIMAGDRETAMMVMRMEAGLDTGPICLSERVTINETTTAQKLHDDLKTRCASLMVKALEQCEAGTLPSTPQPLEGVTYAAKITKAEAAISFTVPARAVVAHIHGLSPFPGAWLELTPEGGKPERIKVLTAKVAEGRGTPGQRLGPGLTFACLEGAVEFLTVQRAGKKEMFATEFLRGFPLPLGRGLG